MSLVSLCIESIMLKNSHLLKQRNKSPNEFLIFILEKFNLLNDILMSKLDDPRFEYTWEIINQFLIVDFIKSFLMIIFDKFLNS